MSTRAQDVWMGALAGGVHEPTAKRIRIEHEGHLVADTTQALLVWEPRRVVPSYAVPVDDLHAEVTAAGEAHDGSDGSELPVLHPGIPFVVHTAPGESLTVHTPTAIIADAAFRPVDPDLAGYVVVDFFSFDTWYEEDERIVGHPRSPFSRVDVRRSARHVRVELDGLVLADSRRPTMVFETGLPARYYLPAEDVRTDALRPSATRTWCAYKGEASYWTVETGNRTWVDVVWTYEHPLPDAVEIAGRLAFFDERVDVIVDGRRAERPTSEFDEVGWQDGTERPAPRRRSS